MNKQKVLGIFGLILVVISLFSFMIWLILWSPIGFLRSPIGFFLEGEEGGANYFSVRLGSYDKGEHVQLEIINLDLDLSYKIVRFYTIEELRGPVSHQQVILLTNRTEYLYIFKLSSETVIELQQWNATQMNYNPIAMLHFVKV